MLRQQLANEGANRSIKIKLFFSTKLCKNASIIVEYRSMQCMKLKIEPKMNESQISTTECWNPSRQIHLIWHIPGRVLDPRIREPPHDFHGLQVEPEISDG